MRSYFFFGGLVSCAALFMFACGSSDDTDNTEYGPPDAGQPDADYCISDLDCPPDDAGNDYACGFPIADTCEARGVCVAVMPGAAKCAAPNYCGCGGGLVTTCPLTDTSYVRLGPTNGNKPTTLADGGVGCN